MTFAPPLVRIAPVAMIEPCPFMRRGTEATVPIVPGFVSVIVAPAKSSGTSLLVRALSTSASYVVWKVAKSMPSACLMTGTTRACLPSFFSTSTARPRFTACGSKRCGFPSTSWKACVMTGSSRAARAIAYPIRCVKEIFLPAAASWAFSPRRRASSTSTVISRNEVAVGTERESVMFCARRAAGPVMGVRPAPQHFRSVRRDDRELGALPVVEQLAPFLAHRGGIAQVLLVHDLHEGGVMGAEDELAHPSNLIKWRTRRRSSRSRPSPRREGCEFQDRVPVTTRTA